MKPFFRYVKMVPAFIAESRKIRRDPSSLIMRSSIFFLPLLQVRTTLTTLSAGRNCACGVLLLPFADELPAAPDDGVAFSFCFDFGFGFGGAELDELADELLAVPFADELAAFLS